MDAIMFSRSRSWLGRKNRRKRLFLSYIFVTSLLVLCTFSVRSLYSLSAGYRQTEIFSIYEGSRDEKSSIESLAPKSHPVGRAGPTWRSRVRKGGEFTCLFEAPNEEIARRLNGGKPVASTMTNFFLFQRWGYEEMKWTDPPTYSPFLDEALSGLGIDQTKGMEYTYFHNCEDKNGNPIPIRNGKGELIEASLAHYTNVVNPTDGVIIADDNIGPEHSSIAGPPFPDLRQWSDIVFLQWQQYSGDQIQNLKLIIRAHVVNEDTQKWVIEAFRRTGATSIPTFDNRAIFSMESDEGKAILGTKNGAGCAYFVVQHKEQLGLKRISEVAVWSLKEWPLDQNRNELYLSLSFKVENII